MRDFLTGIAILLIVALTTMLVAPYLVDWNGQRGLIETQLTRVLGQKVTIGGDIDLKLLPTPYLRLNQTVIGGDDGPVRISIHHLDLELSVAPLLHGEFDIIEGRLDEPTIRVSLQKDRTLPALPDTPAFRADVRLERITIVDGTLAIADPQSGHTFVADHLDFSAEAPSLAGPFKGSGSQGADAERTKFRFSTTAAAKGATRLHLAITETTNHPGLDLDGDVALTADGTDRVRQSFAGTAVTTGHLVDAADAPIAWRLSGALKATPQAASLFDGEFRIGGEDAALSFQAGVDGDFRGDPTLHVMLSAKQLDIDRLSGAPVDAVKPAPPKLPSLARLRNIMAKLPAVPTIADVRVDAATWGGETLNALSTHLGLGGAVPHEIAFSGEGPGALHVGANGRLSASGVFSGRFDVAAKNVPMALHWIGNVAPDMTVRAEDLPFSSVRVTGSLDPAANGVDVGDLTLAVDRSKLAGSARVAFGDATRPPNVSADLRTATLDLDGLPDLHSIVTRRRSFDLALKLDAGSVKIARVGDGPLDAGLVHLDLAATGQHVVVNAFRAENLGGASVTSSGTFDGEAATLALSIDATRLDQAAALVKQLAPGAPADALATRAASLAPAQLKIDARFAEDAAGKLASKRLDITGHAASTRLDIHLAPDRNGQDVTLAARADAPQGSALLHQLGFATLPLTTIGASHVSITASGPLGGMLGTKVDAAFGDTHVAVEGRFELPGQETRGSGTMRLTSPDAAPLLQIMSLYAPDITGRLPADVSAGLAIGPAGVTLGDLRGRFDEVAIGGALNWRTGNGAGPALTGALNLDHVALGTLFELALGPGRPAAAGATWSAEPFTTGLLDPPQSSLALRATSLELGFGLVAHDATFDLGTGTDVLTLKNGQAAFAGGRLTGDLSLRRDGQQATLTGSLALDKASLSLPAIKGVLSGKLDVAGSGTSALALVSSFAGSGGAALADATVAGADPRALPGIFAEVENDTLAVDDDSVRRAFEEAAKGPIAMGARRFGLSLAGGTLVASALDKSLAAGPIAGTLDGSLDLRRPRLQVNVGETLNDLPKNWSGAPPAIIVTQSGPPRNTTRRFDVSAFVNALAARAIARESARIESYEFDIRERAFFNARLESDQRRDQDRAATDAARRAAADAARRAEVERRAKADAARIEKLRQDQRPDDSGGGRPLPGGQRPPTDQRSDGPTGTRANPFRSAPN